MKKIKQILFISLLFFVFPLNAENNKKIEYSKYAFFGDYNPYDHLIIYTEQKDKSYIIQSVAGFMKFEKNWEGCLKEQDAVSNQVQELFSNTKKPPFIRLPCPVGFSTNLFTLPLEISKAPNRAGGVTAVTVALTFCSV